MNHMQPQASTSSRAFRTKASACSRSRGVFALVRALEYIVQGGLIQQTSGGGSAISGVIFRTSMHMSGSAAGSTSTVTHSQPAALKTLDTEAVPLKSSTSFGVRF
jgi:hypothetical protein